MLKGNVIIRTELGDDLKGHLYVGRDGLPEMELHDRSIPGITFRPSQCPAAWTLHSAPGESGILLGAWNQIQEIQTKLAIAQREAEEEPEDDAKEHERERSTQNALAREIDEMRGGTTDERPE